MGFVLLTIAATLGCSPPQEPEAVFRTNMQTEPSTIDPGRANVSNSVLVASQVFDGLFRYDQNLRLTPNVAAEIPTQANGGISADGKTYTLRLTESRWSDGRPVRAADFVYAIKRSLDPDLAAIYATMLYDIEGAQAYNTAKTAGKSPSEIMTLRDAVGVSAPNDRTMVIQLQAPRATFTHILALWIAWPVREDMVAAYGNQWTEPPHYIGNGPFVLSLWEHNSRLEFTPNPFYVNGKPKLSRLVLMQLGDANQAFLAYRNNELDAVSIPEGAVQLAETDPELSQQRVRVAELSTFGYQFNVAAAPFNDVRVRQAFAMAFDRQAFIEKLSQGVGLVARGVVPPGIATHDPTVGQPFDFNAAKARQTLAWAGYPPAAGFPKATLMFADTSSNRLRAEFFQFQIKQNLGVEITLEALESKTFQQRYNARQYQIAFSGWNADYPDPDDFVPELFSTGSGNNHNSYSNPQVDTLSKDCRGLLDEALRLAACAKAQELVMADQPWVFVLHRERYWLVKPYVKGFVTTPRDQLPGSRFYRNISIAR